MVSNKCALIFDCPYCKGIDHNCKENYCKKEFCEICNGKGKMIICHNCKKIGKLFNESLKYIAKCEHCQEELTSFQIY